MKNCPNCGNEINDNAKFCTSCGTKLEEIKQEEPEVIYSKFCKKCGERISSESVFCPKCGTNQNGEYSEKVYGNGNNKPNIQNNNGLDGLGVFTLVLTIINVVSCSIIAPIALIISFVGLFLKRSKSSKICSIICTIINLLLVILLIVFIVMWIRLANDIFSNNYDPNFDYFVYGRK